MEFLLARPGLLQIVLDQHRDDGTGHCSTCTGGAQAGRMTWPCRTRDAATAAAALNHQGSGDDVDRADTLRRPRR